MKLCSRWWCLHTICFCCSSLMLYIFQNTGSKSRHSAWSMFFRPERSSERQDMWLWNFQQNIRIKMCRKLMSYKTVSNIPVLASVCFMRSVYLTKYSASQELFGKIETRMWRKWYNTENFPIFLHHLYVNEGNYILT